MAIIEVKGGRVTYENGTWFTYGQNGRKEINPPDQARKVFYTIRDYVRDRWSFGPVRGDWMLCFPFTETNGDMGIEAPAYKIIDRHKLPNAYSMIRDEVSRVGNDYPLPAGYWEQAFMSLVRGRGTPERDIAGNVVAHEVLVERLTASQSRTLDLLVDNPRLRVLGGAGTGKTWIAMEQARRWSRQGLRVGFLTYTKGIARYATKVFANGPASDSPAFVGSFHQLATTWGVQIPADAAQDYWDVTVPHIMLDLARELPDDERFDAWVVDEAQDFADSWWTALLAASRDQSNVRLLVAQDDRQAVFGRQGSPPGFLATVRLNENMRNCKEICTGLNLLTGDSLEPQGPDGERIQIVFSDDAIADADGIVDELLEKGWDYKDIALLTTKHRHQMQVMMMESPSGDYWEQLWDNTEIFYSTVAAFKGLERPVIVLALNGFHDHAEARDILYTGMSRARDLLVIVGARDVLRTVLGEQVLRQLTAR